MRVSKYFGQTVLLVVLLASPLFADDKGTADDLPISPEAELAAKQLQLATKLARIQDLFDDLRQFEEDVNPRRVPIAVAIGHFQCDRCAATIPCQKELPLVADDLFTVIDAEGTTK